MNRALDAVAGWLSTLANEHSVMLVIDDLHWAAPQALITIRRLLRTQPEHGFGMLVTYAVPTSPPAIRSWSCSSTSAEPACSTRCRSKDSALVPSARSPRHMCGEPQALGAVAPLHAATGGNAFFVTEALAQLLDTGVALSDASVGALLSPVSAT